MARASVVVVFAMAMVAIAATGCAFALLYG